MALTGLEIFKLLPKTNCKKCGMPTCLAFAMALAQKRAKLEDCPYVSEEAKQKLAEASAPPMRLIKFGSEANQVQIGRETVLFRHEEKFHNPTVLGVTVSDKLTNDDLKERIEAINRLSFERVGTKIAVNAVTVLNDSKDPSIFAEVCEKVANNSSLAMILVSDSPKAIAAGLQRSTKSIPLIGFAISDTADEMAKIAKDNGCPLIVKADTVEDLAYLTESIKAKGFEDLVLCLDGSSLREQLYNLTRMRALCNKKVFRPLGYPTISFVNRCSYDFAEQSAAGIVTRDDMEAAIAVSLICKYSNIVVIDTVKEYAVLAMLTARMNIFSDPQKPVQVESKVYAIGEPDADAPLMFTTNFSLTYYSVESDVEASRVPSYILVVDTEGTSVLTAYSGDKLNEKVVAEAMAKHNVDRLVKHRKLIIPGYVAVMSGKLEEATGWEVMVGPRECSMLPKYLHEVWK